MADTKRVLGFMSGTSMDGIDAAIVETDGDVISARGARFARPYEAAERRVLRAALAAAQDWTHGAPMPEAVAEGERTITAAHVDAANEILAEAGLTAADIDLIGMHGQTILHRPDLRWTVQIGDAGALAKATGIDVVSDFRQADVAAGGEGAPFAPLYHAALVRSLSAGALPDGPVVVVNMGGVGNVTYCDGDTVLAFDTGPANGPIDDWVQAHTDQVHDWGGNLAASGRVDEGRITKALMHLFFTRTPPKSLDRLDFTAALATGLSLEDGAATLTAFSAASLAAAKDHFPGDPVAWIVCGGGRKNPTLMRMIAERTGAKVLAAEDCGWRGDEVEAEAFAYLAARSVLGLPLSLPTTTGVPKPMTGGVLYKA